jgi:hypothetical protein
VLGISLLAVGTLKAQEHRPPSAEAASEPDDSDVEFSEDFDLRSDELSPAAADTDEDPFGLKKLPAADNLPSAPEGADARSVRLAEKTVYRYGGPETRVRCIGQLKTKGIPKCRFRRTKLYCKDTWIKTCTEWATDFKQHALYVTMYGPPDMDKKQLREIKDACFVSAVSTALTGITLTIDGAAALVSGKLPIMESTFRTCIKTTETLGRLVVDEFRLKLESKEFW